MLSVATGAGQGHQHIGFDRRVGRVPGERDGGVVDRRHLRTQPRRHHLVELAQRPKRRFPDTGDASTSGQAAGRPPSPPLRRDRAAAAAARHPHPAGSRRRVPCWPAPDSRGHAACPTSRRTLRVVTPSRSASSSPDQTRRDCSMPSSCSTRLVVSDTLSDSHTLRTETVLYR